MKRALFILVLLISSCANAPQKGKDSTDIQPLYQAGLSVRIYAQKGVDSAGNLYVQIVSVNLDTGEIHEASRHYGNADVQPLYQAGLSVRIYVQKGFDSAGKPYETIVSVNLDSGEIHESSAHHLK
jgi:hypothetical protein